MKNIFLTLVFFQLLLTGFPQNSNFEYTGRIAPSIKKAKLYEAKFINEIMPQFARYLVIPFNERSEFDKRRISLYPQGIFYPQENFDYFIEYSSIEISAICNGVVLNSQSASNLLSSEQKKIINASDMGSDISIKIRFKYKNPGNDGLHIKNNIVEGEYTVTVVPETEAEFPGGLKNLSEYLSENVFNKISEKSSLEKMEQAIVKFMVNEQGQIVDVRISKTSTVSQIDQLLLDAIHNMPKWKPAENSERKKVKQEFSIPLGSSGC